MIANVPTLAVSTTSVACTILLPSVLMQLDPPPSYIQSRIELFDKLKVEYDAMVAGMHATLPRILSYYELCPVINRQN